jgi:hypothetical protein
MRSVKMATFAVAATALAACQTSPVSEPSVWQSVDFARGCWISRSDDDGVSTLRLLPSRTNAGMLEGYLQAFDGTNTIGHKLLTLAQSGSHATIESSGYLNGTFGRVLHPRWFEPRYSNSASFESHSGPEGKSRIINFEGDEENLRIAYSDGPSHDFILYIVLFQGQRDGCD